MSSWRAPGEVRDEPADLAVGDPNVVYHGMIWDVVASQADLGEGGVVRREYIRHPGAVWIMTLDDSDRLLLQRQYRHPVRTYLWEPPAGLCDVAGEPPAVTARRELAEEADLVAGRLDLLAEYFTSPGGSSERIWVYLARDLAPAGLGYEREAEELGMPSVWLPLEDVEAGVLAGRFHAPPTVMGALLVAAARRAGWATLAPV